jgi:glycosyltransferase involved in cell wall biosynthesis
MSLRVLHVIGGLELGGAETLLYRLIDRSSDIEHEVIAISGRDWYSPILEARGIKVTHLNASSIQSVPGALLRLSRLIRKSRPNVVHCWMYAANVLGGVAAKLAGKPTIWAIHSSSIAPLSFKGRTFARIGGLIAPFATDFVINCSNVSAELHRRLGYGRAPGAVIHNGYDPQAFFPDDRERREVRAGLGISADTFVIGCISRWHLHKDIPNLLTAVATLRSSGHDFRCILAGAGVGPGNLRLKQAIEDLNCEGQVMPLGRRSDLPRLVRAFDLHVLPSLTEAFPSVVAETMLSGVPNVVTDVGDAAFMVADTGWVVPPQDSMRLAAAIREAADEAGKDPRRWGSAPCGDASTHCREFHV